MTREKRRAVCIHEAAHAVVAALGGTSVYSVEVAPVGWTNWKARGPKRGELADLWGACRTSDLGIAPIALRWNDDDCLYEVNSRVLKVYMKALQGTGSEVSDEATREIRAYVCQCLAGPMAEMVVENKTDCFVEPDERSPHDDLTVAQACCWMLPYRNEWDHLRKITQAVLREHWGLVVRLADALEAEGLLGEGIGNYLPPPIKAWPPSPGRRYDEDVVGQ